MTCIVAIEHEGRIYMGADSLGTAPNGEKSSRLDRKMFRNNGYLMGMFGDYRAGQIIKHRFEMPDFPPEFLPKNYLGENLPEKICLENLPSDLLIKVENFFATDFVDQMKFAFSESGFSWGEEDWFGFIVAYGPYFCTITCDFQVAFQSDYAAEGSGGPVALGALSVLTDNDPIDRLRKALESAQKHNASVGAPFYYDHT
jgi:hypothetical protein